MEENISNTQNTQGYARKRPLWQWVLIYIIIAGAVYGLVYFIFLLPK